MPSLEEPWINHCLSSGLQLNDISQEEVDKRLTGDSILTLSPEGPAETLTEGSGLMLAGTYLWDILQGYTPHIPPIPKWQGQIITEPALSIGSSPPLNLVTDLESEPTGPCGCPFHFTLPLLSGDCPPRLTMAWGAPSSLYSASQESTVPLNQHVNLTYKHVKLTRRGDKSVLVA